MALRTRGLVWVVGVDPLCGVHFGERQSGVSLTSLGKSVIWLWVLIGFFREK